MSAKSPPAPFRILALSGGGFLGLYTAVVLAELEARAGEPLGRRFDLLAGTSVGGLLAMALAFEVPMQHMVALFVQRGEEVFSSRRLPGGTVTRLLDMTRSVLGPKYSGDALRRELQQHFGARTLGDALHAVVVPAVDVTHGTTKVFKTPHTHGSLGDGALPVVDVTLATCAAPAYFPCVDVGGRLYADGGLFAVAPDQVALHEAVHFMGAKPGRVRMLSVGTGTVGYQPADPVEADAGAVGWLTDGRLILTLLSVQQQHVRAMVQDQLEERYWRIDAPWPAQAGLGIDVATPQAVATLREMGEASLASMDAARLRTFLEG